MHGDNMLRNKTTFILGAGASWHFGYPTGAELIQQMLDVGQHNEFIPQGGSHRSPKKSKLYKEFIQKLKSPGTINIDYFLSQNPAFEKFGKILISTILKSYENIEAFDIGAEIPVKLANEENRVYRRGTEPDIESDESFFKRIEENLPKKEVRGNWYNYLLHMILHDCKNDQDIEKSINNLNVITFNYDLSLEYYALEQLRKTEICKSHDKIFEQLLEKICHVYGRLYKINKDNSFVQFNTYGTDRNYLSGLYTNPEDLIDRDNNILINAYAESNAKYNQANNNTHEDSILVIGGEKTSDRQESDDIKCARNDMFNSENIYILGYGFDDNNNDILELEKLENYSSSIKRIFITNYNNRENINAKIKYLTGSAYHEDEVIISDKNVLNAFEYDFEY